MTSTGPGTRPEIVVIGGGLAGISAALACADAGARVQLFEKRDQLGGLTRSFRHDGLWMDNGQHVFLRCCTSYLSFLERIGSADDVELQEHLEVTVLKPPQVAQRPPGLRRAVISRSRWPAPMHLARSLLAYSFLPLPERLRLAPAAVALARLDLAAPDLDSQSFASWLAARHQKHVAVEALWDLICRPTVNLPAEEASLAMAAKVFQTGLLADNKGADIGWSRVPLAKLHGERAATALQRAGVQVRTGEAVTAVRPLRPSVAKEQTGRFAIELEGSEVRADGVVVALPHNVVEDVLPTGVLPAGTRPSQLGSSPIVNVHVHFDRRVTDLPFAASLGTVAQWVFDRTSSSGATTGQYLAVSISAAQSYRGTHPNEIKAQVLTALAELFPAARGARALTTLVTKEPHATFSASTGSAAHRAPPRTLLPGLVLAGAWTSTGWPPTMESAVRSGTAAARAVLVATGHRKTLPPLPREAA
ncbi:MAG: hydroxysqualene dehydroxylase HpnE [Acidimicrobiales bacterium]